MKLRILSTVAASITLLGAGSPALMAASADEGVAVHELGDYGNETAFKGKPKSRMPLLKNPPRANQLRRPIGVAGSIDDKGRTSNAYGAQKWGYTTATVKPMTSPKKKDLNNVATSSKPFLAAGKIHMQFGSSNYVCSGSMIGKGIVVTAAHCVSEWGEGSAGYATNVYFIPGATKNTNLSSSGPIGRWKAKQLVVPTCYIKGSCKNTSSGVVSSNDIAIIVLAGNKSKLPGKKGAGYYGYGWNGYGFTKGSQFASGKSMAQITQLGYPGAIGDKSSNRGGAMIRTDSAAMYYEPASGVKNLIWGSSQTGGSSGGPELVNFGTKPYYGYGSSAGTPTNHNIVVGTTSWGYTSTTQNVQGASWFGQNAEFSSSSYKDTSGKNWGAGNIGYLLRKVCGKGSAYLGYQAKGYCR